MKRIVVGGAMAVLVALAAALHLRTPQASAAEDLQTAQLLERMAALERSIAALAAAQQARDTASLNASAVPVASSGKGPPPIAAADPHHEDAIRAGNAVVDRAIDSARWTTADGAAFATATASLDGPERAEIHSRLSAAINQDRVQVDRDVRPF